MQRSSASSARSGVDPNGSPLKSKARPGRAEDAAIFDSESADSTQPAIDRARSSALNTIVKAPAELRRLQTNRRIAFEVFPQGADLWDLGAS